MNHKVMWCIGVVIAVTSGAQKINVRGKVTDGNGNPVKAAIVSLERQNLADTTTDDGTYTITENGVGALAALSPRTGGITFNKGIIEFRLAGPSPLKVMVYDVKGSLLKKEIVSDAQPGIWQFDIAGSIRSTRVLVIHASTDSDETTFRYLGLKKSTAASVGNFGRSSSERGFLAQGAGDAEYLKVIADGYRADSVAIGSYDTTVDFTLENAGGVLCEGCGKTDHPESGKASIDVGGEKRDYTLKLPDEYRADTPYMLVFCFHWWGGSMDDVVGGATSGGPYYGLEKLANGQAIFIAPNGLEDDGQPRGWANPGGRDIAYVKTLLAYLNENFCIDQKRIFSTGFSYGGMMSYAIGCAMGDIFRAIAPMSGAFYSGCDKSGEHPIAVWMAHGKSDDVVPLSDGKKALAYFIQKNGCSNETIPVSPSPCVEYQDCKTGYPVIYCEFEGGHGTQKFAPEATWKFFRQFE